VAVVGAGLIAGKRHLPALREQERRVELAAVCDVDLGAAQELARRFGVPRAYGDLSEMLAREKPELVDICTPPQTHARLAVEAMRHGCHVLIEKPMALSLADCDAIVTASREAGVKVCVAHSDLFYEPFLRARELVARGAIGDFRGMRIFLSTPTDYMTSHPEHWAHRLPGGVVGETGPHAVYLTLAFINPIRRARVEATKLLPYPWSPFEDYRIDLIGDHGVSSIALSYATTQWAARLDIRGERGHLLLDLEGRGLVRYRRPALGPLPIALSMLSESAQIGGSLLSEGWRVLTRRARSTHAVLLERFVESIIRDTAPPVTAEEGREAVRVMGMIADALKERAG
jgi:predicted dehydrogenase